MAQITGAISSREYTIQTSPDGAVWTDRSGSAVKIAPASVTRKSGEVNTFDGDLPIVTAGKRQSQIHHVDCVYTEGASDIYEIARIAFEAITDFYIRYAPKGGQTGEFQFTTLAGKIVSLDDPVGDANTGDPVVFGFDLKVPGRTKSVAP